MTEALDKGENAKEQFFSMCRALVEDQTDYPDFSKRNPGIYVEKKFV